MVWKEVVLALSALSAVETARTIILSPIQGSSCSALLVLRYVGVTGVGLRKSLKREDPIIAVGVES